MDVGVIGVDVVKCIGGDFWIDLWWCKVDEVVDFFVVVVVVGLL